MQEKRIRKKQNIKNNTSREIHMYQDKTYRDSKPIKVQLQRNYTSESKQLAGETI